MHLVRRKPKYGRVPGAAKPISDITGLRSGKLVAVEHVGFIGTQAAWRCECDCGGERVVRGPQLKQAANGNPGYVHRPYLNHCGCVDTKHPGYSLEPGYATWKALKSELCDEWQHFPTFAKECVSRRPKRRRYQGLTLCRPDTTKPYGPDNFVWREGFQSGLDKIKSVAAYLQSARGLSANEAANVAAGLTRERLRQLSNTANGVCRFCAGALGKYKGECDRCHDRAYLRKHPMAKVVDGVPVMGRSRQADYPLDKWLDGQTWELTPGEDFACKLASFRALLTRAAAARGVRVVTRRLGGKLYLKAEAP